MRPSIEPVIDPGVREDRRGHRLTWGSLKAVYLPFRRVRRRLTVTVERDAFYVGFHVGWKVPRWWR